MPSAPKDCVSQDIFQTTRWSVILDAWSGSESQQLQKLEVLAKAYWSPLLIYARRFGGTGHEPEDLVQAFFERMFGRAHIGNVQPEDGRFRAFLLRTFKNFILDQQRAANRQKRGGGIEFVPLSADVNAEAPQAEQMFDQAWADSLVDIAFTRLEASYRERNQLPLFETVSHLLASHETTICYDDIGERLDMTAMAVRMAVKRMRERFGHYLRQEVERTVNRPEDVQDELRYLLKLRSA